MKQIRSEYTQITDEYAPMNIHQNGELEGIHRDLAVLSIGPKQIGRSGVKVLINLRSLKEKEVLGQIPDIVIATYDDDIVGVGAVESAASLHNSEQELVKKWADMNLLGYELYLFVAERGTATEIVKKQPGLTPLIKEYFACERKNDLPKIEFDPIFWDSKQ